MDGMTQMAFSFIKAQLDRDNQKYQKMIESRREAGKLGGRPKGSASSDKPEEAKKHDNVNDNDNVDDNDIKNIYTDAFEKLWSAYPRKKEKARAYKCYKARLSEGFSEDALEQVFSELDHKEAAAAELRSRLERLRQEKPL